MPTLAAWNQAKHRLRRRRAAAACRRAPRRTRRPCSPASAKTSQRLRRPRGSSSTVAVDHPRLVRRRPSGCAARSARWRSPRPGRGPRRRSRGSARRSVPAWSATRRRATRSSRKSRSRRDRISEEPTASQYDRVPRSERAEGCPPTERQPSLRGDQCVLSGAGPPPSRTAGRSTWSPRRRPTGSACSTSTSGVTAVAGLLVVLQGLDARLVAERRPRAGRCRTKKPIATTAAATRKTRSIESENPVLNASTTAGGAEEICGRVAEHRVQVDRAGELGRGRRRGRRCRCRSAAW